MQLQCVSANSEGTPEVHGEMDLSNYMLLQSVRLVGAVGIETATFHFVHCSVVNRAYLTRD